MTHRGSGITLSLFLLALIMASLLTTRQSLPRLPLAPKPNHEPPQAKTLPDRQPLPCKVLLSLLH